MNRHTQTVCLQIDTLHMNRQYSVYLHLLPYLRWSCISASLSVVVRYLYLFCARLDLIYVRRAQMCIVSVIRMMMMTMMMMVMMMMTMMMMMMMMMMIFMLLLQVLF